MLVAVTGGSGKIGREVLADLASHGYRTRSVDIGRTGESPGPYRRADLRELWQALDALDGVDAVVHLAGMGAPDAATGHRLLAEQATFATNTISTYNVFLAASSLGIRRIVWASSETVMGFPFEARPPDFLPLDEEHPVRPEYSYALSKAMGEELGRHFARGTGATIVALRFSVVLDEKDYEGLPKYWENPELAAWNLWSYVDIRDVAASCRVAVEAQLEGADEFIVAAPDTLMDRPTSELLSDSAPAVPVRMALDRFQSLQCTHKARDLLGYWPRHSWREYLTAER